MPLPVVIVKFSKLVAVTMPVKLIPVVALLIRRLPVCDDKSNIRVSLPAPPLTVSLPPPVVIVSSKPVPVI